MKMKLMHYWRTLRKAANFYDSENYQEVIKYSKEVGSKYPEFITEINYTALCACLKLGENELFFEILNEVLENDGWYSETILRQSPVFATIQGDSEFEKLAKISIERSAKAINPPNLTVFPKSINRMTDSPLVLALHGQSSLIKEEFEEWKSVVENGYVLGMPHAPNMYWSGKSTGYWNPETATDLIETYVTELKTDNLIDLNNSILGGLSMGGGLAMILSLTGKIPSRGFVVVAPGGIDRDDPEKWQPTIDEAKGRNLKGIIIRGEKDEAIPRDYLVRLVDMLNTSGIPCEFIEYPDLGHWYPPDFSELLRTFMKQ